jgi:hypothetical protein
MKTNLFRTMFLAAAAVVATGTVWAQYPVTATVPFEFKAGTAKLPAGEYELSNLNRGSAAALMIRGTDGGARALTLASNRIDRSTDQRAHLSFRCIGSACTLVELWDGVSGYRWADPKPGKNEPADTRLAVIYVRKPVSAE